MLIGLSLGIHSLWDRGLLQIITQINSKKRNTKYFELVGMKDLYYKRKVLCVRKIVVTK